MLDRHWIRLLYLTCDYAPVLRSPGRRSPAAATTATSEAAATAAGELYAQLIAVIVVPVARVHGIVGIPDSRY